MVVFSNTVMADIAIVGNPDENVGDLTAANVRKLFLGERQSFPSGLHATPINHAAGSPDRKKFFSLVLSMGESNHNRHWKRKRSTSISNSPIEVNSYDELLEEIFSTSGAIGYIDASNVDGRVKVLLIIKDYGGV